MCLEVLTEQQLSTTAVETLIAQLRVVGTDTLANLEAFYVLANSSLLWECEITSYQYWYETLTTTPTVSCPEGVSLVNIAEDKRMVSTEKHYKKEVRKSKSGSRKLAHNPSKSFDHYPGTP